MIATNISLEITGLRDDLKRFTRKFTSDHEESSDLVQDTILKALTYQHKYTTDTNLRGWLFTIMRNTFINSYRKNQQLRTLRDKTKDLHYLNVEDKYTFNTPDGLFEYKDILKNVAALKDDLLVPFKMHASGYKYHEIAEHLDIPIGTVKNRIFNARKEIQKKLSGY